MFPELIQILKKNKKSCWMLFSRPLVVALVDFHLYFSTKEGKRCVQLYIEWSSKCHSLFFPLMFIDIGVFKEHNLSPILLLPYNVLVVIWLSLAKVMDLSLVLHQNLCITKYMTEWIKYCWYFDMVKITFIFNEDRRDKGIPSRDRAPPLQASQTLQMV